MLENFNYAYLAPALYSFYMVIASNFLPELFGCRLQTLLRTNMLAKHITGFILLYFLIIIARPEHADKNVIFTISISILIYIWFFMTTRIPFIILIIILILLLIVYILDIKKNKLESDDKNNNSYVNQIKLGQSIISIIILILTFGGFIYYYNAKQNEYKELFAISKFITGTINCRNSDDYPISNK